MPDSVAASTDEKKQSFLTALRASLDDQTFVKLSLGKSRGNDVARKLRINLVAIKEDMKLRFLFQYPTRDITENLSVDDGCKKIAAILGNDYLSGNLFTTQSDFSLLYSKRGEAMFQQLTASTQSLPSVDHNRKKNHIVELEKDYLVELEVTSPGGQLKATMASKFKQINRFVEIVDELIRESSLSEAPQVSVIDIGAGKGYLTFALYDYLVRKLRKEVSISGIESRPELVRFCNQVAERLEFDQLRFHEGLASSAEFDSVDIMIALHACNTATDDAIFRGIKAMATIIVCAPCCQHQIAPQLSKDNPALRGIHRFGLLKQRQADLVTDAARALLLESFGYRVKVVEFVSTEHTNKNLMLAAVLDSNVDRVAAKSQYEAIKELFGFRELELETLLFANNKNEDHN